MDIIARLKRFIDSQAYSVSQTADMAGIPRPSLSQILSGRNKKVSNELIQKLHTAFPQLNIMWLIFGDGEMLSGERPSISNPDSTNLFNISHPDSDRTQIYNSQDSKISSNLTQNQDTALENKTEDPTNSYTNLPNNAVTNDTQNPINITGPNAIPGKGSDETSSIKISTHDQHNPGASHDLRSYNNQPQANKDPETMETSTRSDHHPYPNISPRKAVSVIVLYDDGTFETMAPKS